jgi:hypothetical protein
LGLNTRATCYTITSSVKGKKTVKTKLFFRRKIKIKIDQISDENIQNSKAMRVLNLKIFIFTKKLKAFLLERNGPLTDRVWRKDFLSIIED